MTGGRKSTDKLDGAYAQDRSVHCGRNAHLSPGDTCAARRGRQVGNSHDFYLRLSRRCAPRRLMCMACRLPRGFARPVINDVSVTPPDTPLIRITPWPDSADERTSLPKGLRIKPLRRILSGRRLDLAQFAVRGYPRRGPLCQRRMPLSQRSTVTSQ